MEGGSVDARTLAERLAEALGLAEGHTRLELSYQDGHLTMWFAHREKLRAGLMETIPVPIDDLLEAAGA